MVNVTVYSGPEVMEYTSSCCTNLHNTLDNLSYPTLGKRCMHHHSWNPKVCSVTPGKSGRDPCTLFTILAYLDVMQDEGTMYWRIKMQCAIMKEPPDQF